jgi:hypothetical protein
VGAVASESTCQPNFSEAIETTSVTGGLVTLATWAAVALGELRFALRRGLLE